MRKSTHSRGMGLLGLAREVVSVPVTLARPAAGLVYDITRSVVESFRSTDVDLDRAGSDIAHRRRRIWERPGRAHIELREVPDDRSDRYLSVVAESVGGTPGVSQVRFHPGAGRVVVDFNDTTTSDTVVAVLESAERDVGADVFGFGRHRPDHPADSEPLVEGVVAIGADVAGLVIASVGKALRIPAVPFELDAAALLTVASYVPWARSFIERQTDSPALSTGLALARAGAGGLSQSLAGPIVDIVHRSSDVVAATARRRSWERLEPELVDWHSGAWQGRLVRPARPGALPDGPIERASRPMTVASSAAAGLGFLVRPNVDRAISFLVAGTPKAARWGREAYASHLSVYLAERDILVLDPVSLQRLDRIDTVVIASDVLVGGPNSELLPFAPEVLAAARDAEVEVWVATNDPKPVERLEVKGTVPWEAVDTVRGMQASGRGVAVLAGGCHPGLAVADVALALRVPGVPLSWEASLIGGTELIDGLLLMMAIASAKTASRQSAHVALAGTGVAGLMAFGGVIPGNLGRVIGAVNLAALVAHANGARLAVTLAQQNLPEAPDRRPFHAMSIPEVLSLLESRPSGLRPNEVAARTSQVRPSPPAGLLLARAVSDELVNPLTPFLAAGAGLSAAAGSASDAFLVGGVVGLNAAIGGFQRFKADRATAALLRTQATRVRVRRGDTILTATSDELVVGDIVSLQAGEVVPADCRIVEDHCLEVDESTLTGESVPVAKAARACDVLAAVADRRSMLYSGTTIAAGSAVAAVIATGRHTEAYRGLLLAGRGATPTGVEARLESLTTMVTPASVLAGLGVLGSGVARGKPIADVLGAGVSLAVAAVPEGLPLLATAAQQAAARRLSKRGVIVRNSRAIEALGRVDTLCADKTGTLTLGRIRVHLVSDGEVDEVPESLGEARRRVLAVARAATPDAENGDRLPHPTDRAVLYAAEMAGLHRHEELDGWAPLEEIPFEPNRGFHAIVGSTQRDSLLCVKGAPEVILPRCTRRIDSAGRRAPASGRTRAAWQAHVEELAHAGLRILVVAERTIRRGTSLDEQQISDLTFVGLLALKDPIRDTARQAVEDLGSAGVRVIMITGDHPVTALGIASELGLSTVGCLTGDEIDRLTDTELGGRLTEATVCARVTPAHKVRIVRALQHRGHVVAMTGDGANDAPAIRLAEVGIALGTRATDAARDASDLVVTDDRIETIVNAVVEGRALWASVRDATAILVGGNLGEITFTLAGSLLTGSPPINTRQLLLVNLMTDVLPAMAIAVSTPPNVSPDSLLAEGPDASLGDALTRAIVERAIVTTLGTTGGWIAARLTGRRRRADTVALASLVATELGQTLLTGWRSPFVVASGVGSMAALVGVIQTPGLSRLFGCTPLGPLAWSQALSSAGVATIGSFAVSPLVDRLMPARST